MEANFLNGAATQKEINYAVLSWYDIPIHGDHFRVYRCHDP